MTTTKGRPPGFRTESHFLPLGPPLAVPSSQTEARLSRDEELLPQTHMAGTLSILKVKRQVQEGLMQMALLLVI